MSEYHYHSICRVQVEWYLANGRFKESRLSKDSSGVPYVIGDWSWNRIHPDKTEFIDLQLEAICLPMRKPAHERRS